jgi:hypothetical protein
MAKDDMTGLLLLGGVAAAGYLLYTNGTLQSWFPSLFATTPATTPAPSPPAATTPPATTANSQSTQPANSPSAPALTVQDAATFPYSSAVTAAQMQAIHDQLVTEFDAGQIPQIAGDSVLAYMLSWGGQPNGATETIAGETYTFDGTNWNLSTGVVGTAVSSGSVTDPIVGRPVLGISGLGRSQNRVPLGLIHGPRDYRFRSGR